MHAMNHNVIVKKIEHEKKYGSIIIPHKDEAIIRAEVVSVGPGRISDSGVREPIDLQPGDKILMHGLSFVRSEFEHEGEKYISVEEQHIISKYED